MEQAMPVRAPKLRDVVLHGRRQPQVIQHARTQVFGYAAHRLDRPFDQTQCRGQTVADALQLAHIGSAASPGRCAGPSATGPVRRASSRAMRRAPPRARFAGTRRARAAWPATPADSAPRGGSVRCAPRPAARVGAQAMQFDMGTHPRQHLVGLVGLGDVVDGARRKPRILSSVSRSADRKITGTFWVRASARRRRHTS